MSKAHFARGEESLRDASRRNGGHVVRLTEVLEIVGEAPRAKTCDAILGIIEEGKCIMDEFEGSPRLGRWPGRRCASGRAI